MNKLHKYWMNLNLMMLLGLLLVLPFVPFVKISQKNIEGPFATSGGVVLSKSVVFESSPAAVESTQSVIESTQAVKELSK